MNAGRIDHPTTTHKLDWYDPNALHTKAYQRHLIVQLVNSAVTDVVAKDDVSYDALLGILDRWIATSIDWSALEPFTVLGIDEIALKKGHRDFVAVLTAKTASGRLHLLAILPDRLKATLVAWLQAMPEEHRRRIRTVCTDMWEGYVSAVQDVLPAATLVIERFDVARHYRDGVDQLREQELRRVRATLPDELQDDLKHILWPSGNRPADLDDEERVQLERFVVHSPALQQAITLREELTTISGKKARIWLPSKARSFVVRPQGRLQPYCWAAMPWLYQIGFCLLSMGIPLGLHNRTCPLFDLIDHLFYT